MIFLSSKNIFCTTRNTGPKSNVTCCTSHNLNDTTALMGFRCISKFVNSFHSCIYSCIKSYSILCTGYIKVNGSRYSYRVYSLFRKSARSVERTVTTDNYYTVNTMLTADFCCLLLIFFLFKFKTSSSIKDCSSCLNDV